MDVVSTLFKFCIIAFLLFANAFFVAVEFSFVKVRKTRMEELSKQGNKVADIVLKQMANLDKVVGVAQFGVTFASIGIGWVGEATISSIIQTMFNDILPPQDAQLIAIHTISSVAAFIFVTFVHVALGEQVPKLISLQNTEETVLMVARPTYIVSVIFNPFVKLLNGFCNFVLKVLKIERPKTSFAHSPEELDMLVDASYKEGVLNETEKEILHNAFKFSDLTAKQVMIPRTDLICLPKNITFDELKQFTIKNQYTRYPIYGEDIDDIVGFLHVKDIYACNVNNEEFKIENIMRPILCVPETITMDNIILEFKKKQSQIAIVVDEFGGTAGLITLEDVFEEIFGELQDEFDDEEEVDIKKISDNTYLTNAMVRLDEMAEFFEVDESYFEDEDVDTIGGLVLKVLGRIAQVNDVVYWKNLSLTVKEIDGVRITKLLIIVKSPFEIEEKTEDEV